MGSDQGQVDAPVDYRLQRRIVRRLAEAVEPAVREVGDAGRELEPSKEQRAKTWSESPPPSVWCRPVGISLS